MRYLVRPDGKRWLTYCAPHGLVIRRDMNFEDAIREVTAWNQIIQANWPAWRERERVKELTREG